MIKIEVIKLAKKLEAPFKWTWSCYSDGEQPCGKYSSCRKRSQQFFQDIIRLLRSYVDDKEILGSGMFTVDGHVLYSSLASNTLFSIIKEFEVRSEKKLSSLKKMYLELENDQKICSIFFSQH